MYANSAPVLAPQTATVDRRSVAIANEERKLAVLTVDDRGMICDCDRGGEALFKCHRGQLVWRHVSTVLPQLAKLDLLQDGQPNPRLRFLCHIGRPIRVLAQDGEIFAGELFLNVLNNRIGQGRLVLIVRRADETADQGVFSPV